jgi:peptide/nickel transport system substrate-binding protein
MAKRTVSIRMRSNATVRGLRQCLLFALALAVCLSACAAPAKPEAKGGGGEFRVVLASEPQSLNPDLRVDDAAFTVAQSLYNKLVTLDADYRVIPDLAEKWEVSDDGLLYTFHLAKNVKWHDGQPLSSADVKWTFETLARDKGVAQETAAKVADIQTPDATTVVMRLKEPWSPFIPTVAWYGAFILPKHIYEGSDWTQNPANDKPVGTGPFKFVEWVKGDHITLAAYKDYFRRGPFLDQITYRLFKDPSAMALDLLPKGEVEYTLARPAFERIPELKRAAGIKVQTFPHPARYYIGFNLRRKPWDDLRVRQAVNMAINRSILVERALLGYGSPGLGLYTPAVDWAFNAKAQAPAFDAAGAEMLLDQAGLIRGPDGTRCKLTLVTANASPYKDVAQAAQEQLRAVGFEAELVLLTPPDYTKRVNQEQNFDLALTDGSWGPDPENLNTRFGSNGANQFMGYASAEFDAAVAQGARQTKLADRAQAYFRAQEILARDLPLAPLAEYAQLLVYRDTVTGLPQMEARGLVTFNDYSLVRVKR